MEITNILNKIKNLKENLEKDLPSLIEGKKEIQTGVYFGENVKVEQNIFFDTSEGLILIDDGTKIKANSILRGPLIVGKNCVINSFAEISRSQIGDVCKIGGEIEECIIKSYSNKAHYGYLGHSYIGSWVNIGAGTSVSTLKNTYGSIKMAGIDTGMQFLGCIIGDYVKTAINTSIFPGKIIGPGTHLYRMITEDVSAFTSYVSKGDLYEIPIEVTIKIQKAMMARRGVEFTKENEDKIRELYKQTEIDREKMGVKKDKIKFS